MKNSLTKEEDKKNILTMIDRIHTIIKGKSFNTASIKMLRERFLKNTNDTTYKLT